MKKLSCPHKETCYVSDPEGSVLICIACEKRLLSDNKEKQTRIKK